MASDCLLSYVRGSSTPFHTRRTYQVVHVGVAHHDQVTRADRHGPANPVHGPDTDGPALAQADEHGGARADPREDARAGVVLAADDEVLRDAGDGERAAAERDHDGRAGLRGHAEVGGDDAAGEDEDAAWCFVVGGGFDLE